METVQEIISSLFAIDSIWSVVFRGIVWFVVAFIIIISVDSPNVDRSLKNMKSNLGFFFMFLILGTVLISLLFGYQPIKT